MHKESAFAIAHVIVNICARFTDMPDILIAQFNKSCPYTIPLYFHKQENQSEEEYRTLIGFKKISSGDTIEFESKDSYTERMSGIIALYAAILQTTDQIGSTSPFSLSSAWVWLAKFLNLKSIEASAAILLIFLEVSLHSNLK